jgi:hypothetical protein
MGFFSAFMDMISGGAQRLGSGIQSASDSMKFNEPTRVDRFLAGPGQTIDMSEAGRQARFEANVAENEKRMAEMADMRDPEGRRTDPNTGRSVRETRGYEDKSTGSIVTSGKSSGGSSTPAAATKTEPTPPAAPKDVSEDDTSSGTLEDEAIAMKKKGKKATILTSAKGLLSDAPTRPERKLKGLIA